MESFFRLSLTFHWKYHGLRGLPGMPAILPHHSLSQQVPICLQGLMQGGFRLPIPLVQSYRSGLDEPEHEETLVQILVSGSS